MFDLIVHVLTDSVMDVIKAIPILLIVYALLYWIENRLRSTPALLEKSAEFGPVVGALAGLVPQCGFSAAASALYVDGYLAPATLVAVFLSTSDEALPVLLSSEAAGGDIVRLFVFKFLLAVAAGYLLKLLWGRKANQNYEIELDMDGGCGCGCSGGPLSGIVGRTLSTAAFLLIIGLAINLAVHLIGVERLSALLLTGSPLQPLICATIGVIPSCAISVLMTELYTSGVIGFGGLIAGLSTGAGFGYMILLRDNRGRRHALRIIGVTWLLAIAGGLIAQMVFG